MVVRTEIDANTVKSGEIDRSNHFPFFSMPNVHEFPIYIDALPMFKPLFHSD